MCKPRIRVRVQKGPQTKEEKKSENKVKMMELTSKQNRKRVEDEKYNRENDFKNNWKGIGKAVSYGGLFFFGDKQSFLCFQVSYCPAKRGNRAGPSRNEYDYSRRGTQAISTLLDCRSCENFGLAHFSIFLLEKKS